MSEPHSAPSKRMIDIITCVRFPDTDERIKELLQIKPWVEPAYYYFNEGDIMEICDTNTLMYCREYFLFSPLLTIGGIYVRSTLSIGGQMQHSPLFRATWKGCKLWQIVLKCM